MRVPATRARAPNFYGLYFPFRVYRTGSFVHLLLFGCALIRSTSRPTLHGEFATFLARSQNYDGPGGVLLGLLDPVLVSELVSLLSFEAATRAFVSP